MKDDFCFFLECIDIFGTVLVMIGFAILPIFLAIQYESLWWLLAEVLILPILAAAIDAGLILFRKAKEYHPRKK